MYSSLQENSKIRYKSKIIRYTEEDSLYMGSTYFQPMIMMLDCRYNAIPLRRFGRHRSTLRGKTRVIGSIPLRAFGNFYNNYKVRR